MVVAKIVDDAAPDEGDTITFTVTVTNSGPARATNVAIDDVLPAGLTAGTVTPSQGSWAEPTWTVGTIDSGSSATLTIEATVDAGTSGSTIANTVTNVVLDQTDSNVSIDDPSESVTVGNTTDLVIGKTVDNAAPDEGDTVTFTVTVTNSGPARATSVTIDDALPAGLTAGTVTPSQGIWTAPTWTVGTIDTGSSATLTIQATVDAGTAGIYHYQHGDKRHSGSDRQQRHLDDPSESVTVGNNTDLVIGKTVDNAAPDEGDTVTFTVMVTNSGPAQATNVSIDDVLPAGLTIGSATPSIGSYTAPTWTVGTLDNDSSATLTIQATVNAGTAGSTITNTVTNVSLDQVDSNVSLDDPSESVIVGVFQIEFDSAANSDTEATGGNIPQLLINGTSTSVRTIDVTISGGTATEGDDFSLTTTVNIPVGVYDGTSSTAITVPLGIIDDDIVESDETVIITLSNPGVGLSIGDANGDASIQSNHTYTVIDDDSAGVTVSPISVTTSEDATTATFTVVLTSQPSADVTIPIISGDPSEGTVDQASLTFTTANWDTAQTVTVTGVDDDQIDGNITYTVSVGDPASTGDSDYDGLSDGDTADVSVTNNDNDVAGVTVSPISLNTSEDATTATFTVVLTSQPTAPVTIDLTNGDTTEGSLDKASLIFDGANWNVAQTVTVTGVDDALADGDITYTVSLEAATSADANYNGRDPADVSVTNTDNDSAGVTVSPISGDTDESGTSATFSVVLTSQPQHRCHHRPITSGDTSEGTVAQASLTFTARQLEHGPDRDGHRRQRRSGRRRYHLHGQRRGGHQRRSQLQRPRPGRCQRHQHR